MSVQVELGQLTEALAEYTYAYLVTVGDDYLPRVVAVVPVYADGVLTVDGIGNSTLRNVIGHPDVTLAYPPGSPDGYTLIVDGHGRCVDRELTITPVSAVLHRHAFSG